MSAPYSWQAPIWKGLRARQKSGELMQAMLLTGQRGVGKSDLARALARAGLCREPADHACGHCESCRQTAAGSHPDLLEIRVQPDKKEILIDQIRDFCASVQLTASRPQGRYGIIYEADRLNPAAANALLKTLEEPPPGVSLLLTADQLMRIPATIRSRCTRIAVPNPGPEQAAEWLQDQGLEPELQRRHIGPCALAREHEQGIRTLQQEGQWSEVLQRLQRSGDAPEAAQRVGEDSFDAFVTWWQIRLLEEMKQASSAMRLRRLWDALISVRQQSHLNFNRLLALEGLFILYLQLASHDGPRA